MADETAGASFQGIPNLSASEETNACVICQEGFDAKKDRVTLTEKGSNTINSISKKFGENVYAAAGRYVHSQCRLKYTNKNYVSMKAAKAKNPFPSPRKRRSFRNEESVSLCLFCNQKARNTKKGSKSEHKLIPVRTLQCKDTILQYCKKRGDADKWSRDVKAKIEYMQDLCAQDAVYHNLCYSCFRNGRSIPSLFGSGEPAAKRRLLTGRPRNDPCLEAFQFVIEVLDNEDSDQVTVPDLVDMMKTKLPADVEPYSAKYMKRKLLEHYDDRIIIAENNGRPNVITLRHTAHSILLEFYRKPRATNDEEQKKVIIETAANFIRCDIQAMESTRDSYPNVDAEQQISFLPISMQLLLSNIFKGRKEKQLTVRIEAIGQAIVQNTRPKTVIAPLQIGLGVQMHRHFGSRFLIDSLHYLGFCSSYYEVRKFAMNAAEEQGITLPMPSENDTIHFVADNVDHNAVTLDGLNTFHGMGIIAVMTPGRNQKRKIPRRDVKLQDIVATGRIGIFFYSSEWKNNSALSFTELPEIAATDPTIHYETLWKISWPLKSPRPSWKGMMQAVHSGKHPGVSEVFFMPMIDLNPSDLTCIYSTLKFVARQARTNHITPVLTFDQPLYLKALSIITSEKADEEVKSVVLRLGSFHTQMSYLGSIGYLMEGSGLQEALELVYAPNAVIHMLSGKAYERAVRGHLLVDAALSALLTADAFQLPWIVVHHEAEDDHPEESACDTACDTACSSHSDEETTEAVKTDTNITETLSTEELSAGTGNDDLDTAAAFLENVLTNQENVELGTDVSDALSRVSARLQKHKELLSECRTGRLWLQYMEMVSLLQRSIKAERTGNFLLHLQCVKDMLPYFAASGHNNYLKSARLYLQEMLKLEETHPDVYRSFLEGHHCVRRSDRYWAGLSTDLVIEQVLMCSLKTNGGLTRGSGMGESERLIWLLSMPACGEVNRCMQLVTGVTSTSEQHKDSSKARQFRDHNDTKKLVSFFQRRNPFNQCGYLRNLADGRAATESVNVDTAKQLGVTIVNSMTGSTLSDIKLKKSNQAVTLANRKAIVATASKPVYVDSTLLFQRLVKIAETRPESVQSVFDFELTNIPTSLFETSGLPRPAAKHLLADFLWSINKQQNIKLPDDIWFVIDGGDLLHKLSWSRGMTYNQVVQSYTDFIITKYGTMTSIVFDGYINGPSIKDATHLRRKNGCKPACDVDFDGDMLVCDTKENFLSNESNKQRFINVLSNALLEAGIETHHASGDADCMIVSTALSKATQCPVAVVGRDTDLLVLLLYHFEPNISNVYFASGVRVWDIRGVQAAVGPHISNNILFGHAFGGCDSVSSLFGVGKKTPLVKLRESSFFREQAAVFVDESRSHEDIIQAGEKAAVLLYGGKDDDSLNTLRYVKYLRQLSTSTTAVDPRRLPPTASAFKFHSMRIYFQVQVWSKLNESVDLVPTDWGWEKTQDLLLPVCTDAAVAPEDLLHVVKCSCKTDCSSARCSCRRNGLYCTASCGECRGMSCMNSLSMTVVESEDVDLCQD